MAATSVRLPDDMVKALDRLAKKEGTDRSTVMKRALAKGIRELAMESAMDEYERGGVTAWGAARRAGVSLWEFLDELKRRGKWFRTDEEHLREQIEALK
jgi:predicted transcriptional regulator